MTTLRVVVQHAEGIHARPAEMVARRAMGYSSSIHVALGEHRVDAKSILDLLTLGAAVGSELEVAAEGEDEAEAAADLAELLQSDFTADRG